MAHSLEHIRDPELEIGIRSLVNDIKNMNNAPMLTIPKSSGVSTLARIATVSKDSNRVAACETPM